MNIPRSATTLVLAVGLGLLGAAAPALAATVPDPALSSRPSATAWIGPALAQIAYCTEHSADLMLPGKAGYEHCLKYGY